MDSSRQTPICGTTFESDLHGLHLSSHCDGHCDRSRWVRGMRGSGKGDYAMFVYSEYVYYVWGVAVRIERIAVCYVNHRSKEAR